MIAASYRPCDGQQVHGRSFGNVINHAPGPTDRSRGGRTAIIVRQRRLDLRAYATARAADTTGSRPEGL
jgi:hypothetical protein